MGMQRCTNPPVHFTKGVPDATLRHTLDYVESLRFIEEVGIKVGNLFVFINLHI
jgi:hypothetical protein